MRCSYFIGVDLVYAEDVLLSNCDGEGVVGAEDQYVLWYVCVVYRVLF